MNIPWKNSKEKTDTKMHTLLDIPKLESVAIIVRYFLWEKGHPGDTKTLVKFDGCYWRWIPRDKKWILDQPLTKEDWYNGHLRSITKPGAEKILTP